MATDLIMKTFGYASLEQDHKNVIVENDMASLKYDTESLSKVRELKNKYFTVQDCIISAYMRDIENDINRKLNG
jgi:hypothetical protein